MHGQNHIKNDYIALLPFLVLPQDCGVWRSLPYVLQGHPSGSAEESFGHKALSVPAG